MDQICIVALIGLPAVGKTTFSKLFLEIENLPFNILHICYDNFLNAGMGDSSVSYKEQREELLKSLFSIIESLKTSKTFSNNLLNLQTCSYKDSGHNRILIVCDDNNYYFSMRYRLYQMARMSEISFGQIFFKSNVEMAAERNSLREKTIRVPQEVFEKMYLKMETPLVDVNYWEMNTFTLHMDEVNKHFIKSDVIPFVRLLFECPLKPLEVDKRYPTKQSRVHEFDLLMRKRIGIAMNSVDNKNKKQIALLLNDKRKYMLKQLQETENYLHFDEMFQTFEESVETIVHSLC